MPQAVAMPANGALTFHRQRNRCLQRLEGLFAFVGLDGSGTTKGEGGCSPTSLGSQEMDSPKGRPKPTSEAAPPLGGASATGASGVQTGSSLTDLIAGEILKDIQQEPVGADPNAGEVAASSAAAVVAPPPRPRTRASAVLQDPYRKAAAGLGGECLQHQVRSVPTDLA